MEAYLDKVNWPVAERVLDIGVKALFLVLTMLVAVIAYQGRQVLMTMTDHEVRLTKVEVSRYTPDHAAADHREARAEMKEFIELHIIPIRDTLSEIKESVRENRQARQGS